MFPSSAIPVAPDQLDVAWVVSQRGQVWAGVEADKVSARFENGMLELTLPETEAAKPRRIEIADGPAEAESVA